MKHVYWDANYSAEYYLANLGHNGPFHCVTLETISAALGLILHEDCMGNSLPRVIPWGLCFFYTIIGKKIK